MKKLRYFAALALTIVFTISVFIPGAYAQGNTAFSQEKAIEKIKGMFDTSGYDVFNINYNEDNDRKIWNLNWSNSKEPYGSLNASIDADTGDILNLNFYKGSDSNQKPSLIPKVSEEEARKIAEDFAKKHQPEEFAKTIYRKQQEPIYRPLINRYQQDYSFNFVRVVKDIPVEGDGFYIDVSASTGEIESYSFSWSYDELPPSDNIISMEEAEKIFKNKAGLKLEYKRYFNYNTREDNVKLVYTIDNPKSVLIDAVSGEFMDNANYGPYYRGMGSDDSYMKSAAKQELTPQEQKEVEATKNCITKEAAVKVVQKYLTIPEGYEQNYANLYEDYDNPGQKVWNLSWNKKSEDKSGYGTITARVDATSSDLLSFYIWDDSMNSSDFTQKYDRSAAQKIAENFLNKIQPEKMASIKLEETDNQEHPEKIREHYFRFTRLVGDIPYPNNGFSISVDAVTGKITIYDMSWQERNFPKADGAISKEDAEAGFLRDTGLELSYVRVYSEKMDKNRFYLVYKLSPSASYTFDAFNLKPLDYQGNPIQEHNESVTSFTDIKGHWAEGDIQLLVDMGIIQSREDRFRPDDVISQGEFIRLLMMATGLGPINNDIVLKNGTQADEDSESVQDYIDAAIKAGIVKQGEIDAQKPLPREKMAAFLVRALGFGKVASITGIYTVPAKDAAAIAPAYKGHAAIAMGLSLITGIDGRFEPRGSVTRAQAAVVLVRMLKVQAEK